MYIDATTTPRVYRVRAYHNGVEIVNTTQYLLESEVPATYDKVRKALNEVVGCDEDVKIEIYPA